MSVSVPKIVCLAALNIAISASALWADDTGREEYVNACAACHGVSGTGDGPMAEFMSVKVPDLSLLAARNDGDFPMLNVIQTIDGRTGVRLRGHGSEMPIWGNQFKAESYEAGNFGGETIARGRILSLAYYLQSIQK